MVTACISGYISEEIPNETKVTCKYLHYSINNDVKKKKNLKGKNAINLHPEAATGKLFTIVINEKLHIFNYIIGYLMLPVNNSQIKKNEKYKEKLLSSTRTGTAFTQRGWRRRRKTRTK